MLKELFIQKENNSRWKYVSTESNEGHQKLQICDNYNIFLLFFIFSLLFNPNKMNQMCTVKNSKSVFVRPLTYLEVKCMTTMLPG